MGTHPIFESDFDCLTDMAKGKKGKKVDEDAEWDALEKKQAAAKETGLEDKMNDLSTGEPQLSKSQMKKNKRNQKKAAKAGFADLDDEPEMEDEPRISNGSSKKSAFAALNESSDNASEEEIEIAPPSKTNKKGKKGRKSKFELLAESDPEPEPEPMVEEKTKKSKKKKSKYDELAEEAPAEPIVTEKSKGKAKKVQKWRSYLLKWMNHRQKKSRNKKKKSQKLKRIKPKRKRGKEKKEIMQLI